MQGQYSQTSLSCLHLIYSLSRSQINIVLASNPIKAIKVYEFNIIVYYYMNNKIDYKKKKEKYIYIA